MRIRRVKHRPPIEFERLADADGPPPKFRPRNEAKYLFSLMDVGDCVRINRPAAIVRRALTYHLGKTVNADLRFAVRKVDAASCRVWRTA